jgi:hypothetical protein
MEAPQSPKWLRLSRTRVVVVLTFNRKAGLDPILFSFSVIADLRITHGRQFTGGLI